MNSQPILVHDDRRLGEFNELVSLKLFGGCQVQPLNVFISNLIVNRFIDTFRRQILSQVLLITG
ncbi:MAG: hypothetical protein FJ267_06840 [Planctomycetes bacterium]|nr:hypothetical protein [Planctomycetota bacterium]